MEILNGVIQVDNVAVIVVDYESNSVNTTNSCVCGKFLLIFKAAKLVFSYLTL